MLSLMFLPSPCHCIFYSPYSLTCDRQRGHCYSSSVWRCIAWVCYQAKSFNSITQKYISRGMVFSWCIPGVHQRNAKWQKGCTCADPYECKLARACHQWLNSGNLSKFFKTNGGLFHGFLYAPMNTHSHLYCFPFLSGSCVIIFIKSIPESTFCLLKVSPMFVGLY